MVELQFFSSRGHFFDSTFLGRIGLFFLNLWRIRVLPMVLGIAGDESYDCARVRHGQWVSVGRLVNDHESLLEYCGHLYRVGIRVRARLCIP